MNCKSCNATIPDGMLICPSCGQKVERKSDPTPKNSAAFQPAGDLDSGALDVVTPRIPNPAPAPVTAITSEEEHKTVSYEETGPGTYCSNCGKPLKSGMKFCPRCGTPCSPTGRVGRVDTPPVYIPTYGGDPVTLQAKGFFSGKQFLIATLAFSCHLLCAVFGSASSSGRWLDIIESLIYQSGAYYYMDGMSDLMGILDVFQGGNVLGALLSMTPSVLVCIGLWITYVSAADRTTNTVSTSGLRMIKVINTLQMVVADIGLAIALVILFVAANSVSRYDEMLMAVLMVILALIAVIVAINLYYGKINQTLNTAMRVIETGEASDKVSGFIAVLCFISSALTAFELISDLRWANTWTILGTIGSITAMISFGCMIFSFRNKMRSLSSN